MPLANLGFSPRIVGGPVVIFRPLIACLKNGDRETRFTWNGSASRWEQARARLRASAQEFRDRDGRLLLPEARGWGVLVFSTAVARSETFLSEKLAGVFGLQVHPVARSNVMRYDPQAAELIGADTCISRGPPRGELQVREAGVGPPSIIIPGPMARVPSTPSVRFMRCCVLSPIHRARRC